MTQTENELIFRGLQLALAWVTEMLNRFGHANELKCLKPNGSHKIYLWVLFAVVLSSEWRTFHGACSCNHQKIASNNTSSLAKASLFPPTKMWTKIKHQTSDSKAPPPFGSSTKDIFFPLSGSNPLRKEITSPMLMCHGHEWEKKNKQDGVQIQCCQIFTCCFFIGLDSPFFFVLVGTSQNQETQHEASTLQNGESPKCWLVSSTQSRGLLTDEDTRGGAVTAFYELLFRACCCSSMKLVSKTFFCNTVYAIFVCLLVFLGVCSFWVPPTLRFVTGTWKKMGNDLGNYTNCFFVLKYRIDEKQPLNGAPVRTPPWGFLKQKFIQCTSYTPANPARRHPVNPESENTSVLSLVDSPMICHPVDKG